RRGGVDRGHEAALELEGREGCVGAIGVVWLDVLVPALLDEIGVEEADALDLAEEPFLHVFFFQAEDGIRDFHVTGVQTCALPIFALMLIPFIAKGKARRPVEGPLNAAMGVFGLAFIWWMSVVGIADIIFAYEVQPFRSEERRVGKECRARWAADQYKKKGCVVTAR